MQDRPLTEEDEIEGARQLPVNDVASFEPGFLEEEEPDFAAHFAPQEPPSLHSRGEVEDVVLPTESVDARQADVDVQAAGNNQSSERHRNKPPQNKGAFVRYLSYSLGGVILLSGVLFGLNSLVDNGREDDLTAAASSVTQEMDGEGEDENSVANPIPPQPIAVSKQKAELTERELEPVLPAPQSNNDGATADDGRLKVALEQSKTREANALSQLNASMTIVAKLQKEVDALKAAAAQQELASAQQNVKKDRPATKPDEAKPAPIPQSAKQSAKPAAPKVQVVAAKKHPATPARKPVSNPRPGQTSFVQAVAVTPNNVGSLTPSTGSSFGSGQITGSSVMNGRVVITDQATGKTDVKGVGSVVEGKGSIVSITPNGCVMFSSAQRIGRCE